MKIRWILSLKEYCLMMLAPTERMPSLAKMTYIVFLTHNAGPAATAVSPQQPPELFPIDAIDAVGHEGTVGPLTAPI